jgi:hypothetical protein
VSFLACGAMQAAQKRRILDVRFLACPVMTPRTLILQPDTLERAPLCIDKNVPYLTDLSHHGNRSITGRPTRPICRASPRHFLSAAIARLFCRRR